MLRIAVPNKGSLSGPAAAMLHEAGYRQRKESKELVLFDSANEVEFFYLRPRDIAIYVSSGRLDIGITGRDLLLDSKASAEEILQLGFARSTFRYAAEPGTATGVQDLGGMTVATSYEGIVEKHLADNGVSASVVHLDGAVETAIQLGVAQVIADVVETGTSLRNAGLDDLRRADHGVRGRRHPPHRRRRRGAQGAEVPAPSAGRPGRPQLRDDGLRHPRRAGRARPSPSPPAWSRRPSPRCTTRAGSRSAPWSPPPTPSGSWTSSTTSAPAPSSPPASTPPGCDHAANPDDDRAAAARAELPVTFRPVVTRVVLLTMAARCC